MRKSFFYLLIYVSTYLLADTIDANATLVSLQEYHPLSKIQSTNLHPSYTKGEFAVASIFTDQDEIEWAKKFNIVQLGGIDDKKINSSLLENKGLLAIKNRIGYDWMPAIYYLINNENSSFVNWLFTNKETVTLNPNGPYTHCQENKYDWCHDYYYNFENVDLLEHKISQLTQDMATTGLNGLFFDWGDGGYIDELNYKTVHDNFYRIYPEKNYYESVGNFYKSLRALNIFFITNQAFRKDKFLLPYIQYDMTESYITSVKYENKAVRLEDQTLIQNIQTTMYYPIYENSHTIDDSIKFINILTDMKNKYKNDGFRNFIYLNYLAPQYVQISKENEFYKEVKPKNGIYYGYAMGKLTDNIVYAQVPSNTKLERDDVYFYQLGSPLGDSYTKLDAIKGYIRFYTNGFVLVSSPFTSTKYLKLSSKWLEGKEVLFDAYLNKWITCKESEVTLKLDYETETFTQEQLPLGRIYLYNR
jgi:hypothetical protein